MKYNVSNYKLKIYIFKYRKSNAIGFKLKNIFEFDIKN